MKNLSDAEFHPVIEDFIADFVDGEMGAVEKKAFEELLVFDDSLREFVFAARNGKALLNRYRRSKNYQKFMERISKSAS